MLGGEQTKLQACLCRIHPLKEGSDLLSLAAQSMHEARRTNAVSSVALAQATEALCQRESGRDFAGSSSQVRKASVFTDTAVQFGHWPARFLEQEEPRKVLEKLRRRADDQMRMHNCCMRLWRKHEHLQRLLEDFT